MTRQLRKGDKVIAIAGNSKGQTGTILLKKGERFVVEGLNVRKKHVKRTSQAQSSGIVEREMPIHASNLALLSGDGKPVRLEVAGRTNK